MATAGYYRKQAETCLHMSRMCDDPILAEQLDMLAAEFREAAADQDGVAIVDQARTSRRRMHG